MKDCLVDVLNARDTVLHVFPIAVEDQDGTPNAVDPEREALRLAARMQLVPETEIAGLHARQHVSRGGQLTAYSDVLEMRLQKWDRTQQRIRERAYFLWLHEGCPDNRANEHWHQAREFESNDGLN
jgi:hypothetical protein